tara:strand:- start:45 stop:695 length:651 start_codon:yes stop_codon:yes gene_type:complete
MRRLSKSEGAFVVNMTLFLVGMNLAAGIVTEIGLFEITRYDLTEEQCINGAGDTPSGYGGQWYAQQGGNGYCLISSVIQTAYSNKTAQQVVAISCINADDVVNLQADCEAKTYQDEGTLNAIWDIASKTLGDIMAAMGSLVGIVTQSVINPFGFITNVWLNCAAPDSNLASSCTEAEWRTKQSWDRIIFYLQIPVYLMYGILFIQLIMNRSLRGSM